jgi:hypothetical protein
MQVVEIILHAQEFPSVTLRPALSGKSGLIGHDSARRLLVVLDSWFTIKFNGQPDKRDPDTGEIRANLQRKSRVRFHCCVADETEAGTGGIGKIPQRTRSSQRTPDRAVREGQGHRL